MHVAFSARIFFYVSPLAGFFLDKFPLQEFFGELSHHLRMFLMARAHFLALVTAALAKLIWKTA